MRGPSMVPIPLTPQQVVLIRHGATAWSEGGQHTGRTDLPLLEEGEAQARELKRKLSALLGARPPGLVLSSPLKRAFDTCRLAGYEEVAQVDEDLVEWDYGLYEGLTTPEIQAIHKGWELFRDGCPGGETLGDVTRRACKVIGRLRSNDLLTDRAVLVFAHGHVLRVLTAAWAGFGPEAGRGLPFGTGCLGILGWARDDPALEAWNV
ncbi:MAG: histidine phosphatase family protein [Acidimicrobiales bacterium]